MRMTHLWQRFIKQRTASWALSLCGGLLFLAFAGPLICNQRPLLMSYHGHIYMPIFQDVTWQDLGQDQPRPIDYQDHNVIQEINAHGWLWRAPVEFDAYVIDWDSHVPLPSGSTRRHPLGQLEDGRDTLAVLLAGLRVSVIFGCLLTLASSLIGLVIGMVQGYYGGVIDLLGQRIIDVWSSIPSLYVLIILASLTSRHIGWLFVILLLFSWMNLVGLVRAETLRNRQLDYVKAAVMMGVGHWRIMWRHILPNSTIAAVSMFPFNLAGSMIALSSLNFLGFGLAPYEPTLGGLLAQAYRHLDATTLVMSAVITTGGLLTLFVLLGTSLRQALDPHDG